jgi:hypothetical protein
MREVGCQAVSVLLVRYRAPIGDGTSVGLAAQRQRGAETFSFSPRSHSCPRCRRRVELEKKIHTHVYFFSLYRAASEKAVQKQ